MKKYVILGSAPHMKDYWPKVRNFYISNNYKICAINNAWALEKEHLYRLYLPDDFLRGAGTIIPTEAELNKMNVVYMPKKIKGYFKHTGGTMSINVMHLLLNEAIKNNEKIKVVVIGSDYIYKHDENSHFYGSSKPSEVVNNQLVKNNSKYLGLSADPLRFGTDWLKQELEIVQYRYNLEDCIILNDTVFVEETLLPFKIIDKFIEK